MMRFRLRAAWFGAALFTTAVLASCGGDDVLGPPDGAACTKGSIASGDSVASEVTGASCAGFSDMNYESIWFESWTLSAKKNTAYVVRLRHVENANASDNWAGDLYAYARTASGDPTWATGWYGNFGVTNGNGGYNEEMYLVTDADQSISLRVQVAALADTGAYTLSVESCPIHPIAAGDTVAGVDLAAGCLSLGYVNGTPTRFGFFSFPADTFHTYHATGTRTAGTGTLYAHVSGPDLDVGCYTDSCTWSPFQVGVAAFDIDLSSYISLPGVQTLMVGVNADSAATVSASFASAIIPAPPALASHRRPSGLRQR